MAEKLCGIYKIVNTITGKIYIGLSCNIKNRWKRHRVDLKAGCHDNQYLQNSYNKYGLEAFTFEIIELCDREVLGEREVHYISEYNCMTPNGYNMNSGGEYPIQTPETIRKRVEAIKKKNLTEETHNKRVASGKKIWERPGHKEHMSKKLKEHYEIPENREKLREKFDSARLEKMSETGKRNWLNPEYREKHRLYNEEQRRLNALKPKKAKKYWTEKMPREIVSKIRHDSMVKVWKNDPDRSVRQSKRMYELWNNEEYRKKLEPHFEKMRAGEYAIHKLTDEQLLEVEHKILVDKRTLLDIAKDYDVEEKTILNSMRRLEESRKAPGSIVPFKQKLDEDAIRFMITHDGEYTAMQFSKMFGVGYRAIYDTLKGKNNVKLVNKVKHELNLKP